MLAALTHPLPDFLIIGAQKGGTSSLYDYLCRHPRIRRARQKEVHFFDNQYDRGLDWYRRQFPSRARLAAERLRRGGAVLTGEATPMYLVHPHAPARIHAAGPEARLIVLLREPASRAYSQWQHNQREGWDPLPFEEAIASEDARIAPARAAIEADPSCVDTRFHAWSYQARGRYLEQLERYVARFGRERLLVLCSEELFAEPARIYAQSVAFLGLPAHAQADFPAANAGGYAELPPAVAALREAFRPHNEALFRFLGRRLPWP